MIVEDVGLSSILVVAAWRLSCLIIYEDGPFDMLAKLRDLAGVHYDEYGTIVGEGFFGSLLTCIYCLSVWVAVLIVILYSVAPIPTLYVASVFAISGGVVLLDKIGGD